MTFRGLFFAVASAAAWTLFAVEEPPAAEIEVLRPEAKTPPAVAAQASAPDVLRICRAMLPPRPVELSGALILRSRRGIVQSEHDYRLVMRRGRDDAQLAIHLFERGSTNVVAMVSIARRGDSAPSISLARAGKEPEKIDSLMEKVMDTDVTWLDLTFDFLWWTDASYETEREGESVHGQVCRVILVKPPRPIEGLQAVRLWVDKKTGCLMQAEQVGPSGKSVRRLWGTRVKKFDGKWMVSVLEVETLGTRHRTKITVDSLKEL